VKGGDWLIEDIVGAREVQGWEARCTASRFLHERSTTRC